MAESKAYYKGAKGTKPRLLPGGPTHLEKTLETRKRINNSTNPGDETGDLTEAVPMRAENGTLASLQASAPVRVAICACTRPLKVDSYFWQD